MQFLYLILSALLVLIDFIIKKWAVAVLKPVKHIDIIKNVLSLHYHENRGAAFGILQGKQFFLIAITVVAIIAFIYVVAAKKISGNLLLTSFSLIIGGGIGNLIDRAVQGFVVDYIYFEPINFPIFNFADCCVVIGTCLLLIYIIFIDGKDKKHKDNQEK